MYTTLKWLNEAGSTKQLTFAFWEIKKNLQDLNAM